MFSSYQTNVKLLYTSMTIMIVIILYGIILELTMFKAPPIKAITDGVSSGIVVGGVSVFALLIVTGVYQTV